MKRYNLKECRGYAEYCSAEMQESPTGEYVKYEDVQKLVEVVRCIPQELSEKATLRNVKKKK